MTSSLLTLRQHVELDGGDASISRADDLRRSTREVNHARSDIGSAISDTQNDQVAVLAIGDASLGAEGPYAGRVPRRSHLDPADQGRREPLKL